MAALIPNGATLQIGIGGIPDAVLGCLCDHRDLGIHTEMVSDRMVPLIEAGVINGRRKTVRPGRAVTGFALGTQRIFRFLHENPWQWKGFARWNYTLAWARQPLLDYLGALAQAGAYHDRPRETLV